MPASTKALLCCCTLVLGACTRNVGDAEGQSREVSLSAYTHDFSCWGEVRQGQMSLHGKVIVTEIAGGKIAIFPLSSTCHLSKGDNVSRAFLNVRIGSFATGVESNVLAHRKLDPWLSSEIGYLNKTSLVADFSAECTPQPLQHEPNSLVFSNCRSVELKGGRSILAEHGPWDQ